MRFISPVYTAQLPTFHFLFPPVSTQYFSLYRICILLRHTNNGVKSKGKVPSITGHEDPEMDWSFTSTVSLTTALDEVGGQRHTPAALPP